MLRKGLAVIDKDTFRVRLIFLCGTLGVVLNVMSSASLAKEAATGCKQGQAHSWPWAKPLAQDFVVVHQVRDLGREDRWICVGSPDFITSR